MSQKSVAAQLSTAKADVVKATAAVPAMDDRVVSGYSSEHITAGSRTVSAFAVLKD